MTQSLECNFCDEPSFSDRILSSNEQATSLLSSPRLVAGHSLVVPKRHVESLNELSTDELIAIHELIKPIYSRLLGAYALGVDVWQKSRPNVEQNGIKMNHLHFHVVPSNPGDEIYSEALRWSKDRFESLDPNERDAMIELLTT